MNRRPSYLPAANFSLALIDILGARGVVDAAHGPLLAAAEQADAAALKDPSVANTNASAAARTALENAVTLAQTNNDAALAGVAANPGVASFATAATDAKRTLDIAVAAVAMHDARRAAVALSQTPRTVALANSASDKLETALDLGRALHANFPNPMSHIQEAIKRLPSGHTKESLSVLVDKTKRELKAGEDEVEQYRQNVENWFNDSMDRVGGWYKRWTQWVLFCLAILAVGLGNVDTIHIVQKLTSDTALRASLVTAAEDASKRPSIPPTTDANSSAGKGKDQTADATGSKVPTDAERLQGVLKTAKDLQLPLGWSTTPQDENYYKDFFTRTGDGPNKPNKTFPKIMGLIISIFAISLGAPFWFDTLSKFMNLRGAGTPPGEKSKSAPKATPK